MHKNMLKQTYVIKIKCEPPGSDRGGEKSVGLLEPFWGAAMLNCFGKFGRKVGNYHVTTLRAFHQKIRKRPWPFQFGNLCAIIVYFGKIKLIERWVLVYKIE
jgi:hypothetical protein